MAETYTSGIWFVKPGEEDAFVEAWAEFVATGREAPGSGEFRLVRDLDVPGRYLSFAPWESFDAQKAWRDQPEMQERFQRAQSHCQDFQSSTYELVKVV
jgi:heme-degrading monooxygenase HmoA